MALENENHYLWNVASQEIYEIWGEATIGRSNVVTFYVDHNDVNRVHFKIKMEGEGYVVEDLGSDAGTFYNGFLIEDEEEKPLNFGDVISASSDVHFVYFTGADLKNLSKETLTSALSDEVPSEISDNIIKKSLIFFRMIVPEMKLIIEKRNCEIKKIQILDDKRDKLKKVENKNILIDRKKEELQNAFNQKVEMLNKKYSEVEELRERVLGSFNEPIINLEKRVVSINTELKKIDVKHFFRVGESEETHKAKDEATGEVEEDDGELKLDI